MVRRSSDLLEVELVAEHALAVLAHARLPALPGGAEQGRHLFRAQHGGQLISGTQALPSLHKAEGTVR